MTNKRTRYFKYDNFGIKILATDKVAVISYGYGARLIDCGTISPVVRFTPSRVVIIDADGFERSVCPANLGVRRRDGVEGYEVNRPHDYGHRSCICGAFDHSGCFCDLTPREFYGSKS